MQVTGENPAALPLRVHPARSKKGRSGLTPPGLVFAVVLQLRAAGPEDWDISSPT